MAVKKRSAASSAGTRGQLPQRKRQAISLDPAGSRPSTSNRPGRPGTSATQAQPKRSNRPGYNAQDDSASSGDEDTAAELDPAARSDDDEDAAAEEDGLTRQQALEAAWRKHQLQFLHDASLAPVVAADDEADAGRRTGSSAAKGKGKPQEVKSVWDLGIDDLEEDDDDDDDEESEGNSTGVVKLNQTCSGDAVAEVVAFSEPGRSLSAATGLAGGGGGGVSLSGKELRDFKAGKVKSNILAKASVADEANQKYRGKKGGNKAKVLSAASEGATGGKGVKDTPEDAAEETHLAKLDSHLSSLTKSLHANSASLPDLLRELPLAGHAAKPLKGHTPLPKNAPRSLRSGQNAANLKRAQARDAAQGILAGSKLGTTAGSLGREAKSLKEKRREDGTDKRERGMGGAVGKFGRGMISLSKGEIARVQGMGGAGGASARGGGRGRGRGRGRK
ncbi:hypothetical protein JCM11491_006056 [Sporobolomyces phaffii]